MINDNITHHKKILLKSKIEYDRIIVVSIIFAFLSYVVYSGSSSFLFFIIVFILSEIFLLSMIEDSKFYDDELEMRKVVFNTSIKVKYSDLKIVTLRKRGSIRFETYPHLNIKYVSNNRIKEMKILVEDTPELIDFLKFLNAKGIKITVDSDYDHHQKLTFNDQ